MSAPLDSANQLVTENLALVGYCVSEHMRRVPPHVTRDDLVSAASLALVQASRSYDPAREIPFYRYATTRIHGAILDELRSQDWLSRRTRRRLKEETRLREQLTDGMGREPTLEELATALGSTDTPLAADAAVQRPLAIDANQDAFELVHPEPGPGPESLLLAREEVVHLHAAIDCLPERLQHVIRELYLNDRTVNEVAADLDVDPSRISQMRKQALTLMRGGLTATLNPDSMPPTPENPSLPERRQAKYYASVAARAAFASGSAALHTMPRPMQASASASRPALRVIQGGRTDQNLPNAA